MTTNSRSQVGQLREHELQKQRRLESAQICLLDVVCLLRGLNSEFTSKKLEVDDAPLKYSEDGKRFSNLFLKIKQTL